MLRWPDRGEVHEAVRRWAEDLAAHRDDIVRVGYFGSYAKGSWGVGSDVDLIVVVADSAAEFYRRAAAFDRSSLPVPADLLVITSDEDRRRASPAPDHIVWVLTR